MPIVNLKVLGTLTDEQKSELVKRFTADLEEVAGKPPEYTYVVIEEIPRSNWGHRGKLFSES
ncbi:MAG: 4-oxalocrotonate tautomerase family protein [bacterium]